MRQVRRVPTLTALGRAQIASLAASAIDFGTLILLVEKGHVWYVTATATGALVGAMSNFLLGRYWCFQATHRRLEHQALRYAVISGTSLLMNTGAVYLLTDGLGVQYLASRIVAGAIVGMFFNFPMHRYFVFR
jgi:putative flippase GtrA